MTRANPGEFYQINPEVERNLRKLRRRLKFGCSTEGTLPTSEVIPPSLSPVTNISSNPLPDPNPNNMAQRTIRQLATSHNTAIRSNIEYPNEEWELRPDLLNALPKFNGLSRENPHKHLRQFHMLCENFRSPRITIESLKMRAFPFTLQGAAQDWWYYLSARITNWETIERLFLEKYFPASRLSAIRREIQDIRQRDRENLSEYWERFKKLCSSCPQLQMEDFILSFYEGLSPTDRSWADAASGGSFLDRSPEDGIDLIERKAVDNQQYGTRENSVTLLKGVHEIDNGAVDGKRIDERLNKLESKLDEIASLFKTSTPQIAKKCGICISTNHYTDECPSLVETTVENSSQAFAANMIGGNRPYQNYHDSSSNRYQQNKQPYVPPQQRQQPQPEMSLQDFMKTILEQNSEIKKSIVELTQRVEKLEAKESNKLPAQTVINPQNVSAITLRTGKQVESPEGAQEDEDKEKEGAQIDDNGGPSEPSPETTTDKSRLVSSNSSSKTSSSYSPPPPYPNRLKPRNKKMEELDQEILNIFKKVEINIPLLDAVKQIPKYAKFLKEICTNRRRFRDNEVVNLGRNVSSLIKKHIEIPRKCKDPGMFSVPCVIGNSKFDNAMLDLGASINVMPLSVFTSLSLGPLKTTGVVIQLANRSTVNPAGVLEDVLVRVDKLIFPADFYILDMKDDEGISPTTIILGRPFMMTARTKIDVHAGSLTMEIGDEKVRFNVLEAGKHQIKDHSLFCIDLSSDVVNNFSFSNMSSLILDEKGNCKAGDIEDAVLIDDTFVASECDVKVAENTLGSKMLPSVVQPPVLEKDAKPVRQPQGRLNPQLMGVVKKKDTKLLQTGLKYSNSDSTWVDLIHVVPKKYGITMVKNQKDKLTPIQDRGGSHNVVVDHLSRIEKGKDNIPIQDDFSNEVLLAFLPP
ncbi:uncharacterized protein LOC124847252 [Vigna umbellata]|uniref:uncharacterized protein LOC124830230 n=1 Tax=Vigna umbellata TaxID=87088 RepID=UPI001F5ED141|nr:uncharacterized protein LOC124830230 [Vigna umbellata]XP_047161084.1 uncharacterized protein LOC124831209 [Vigna umbellata]XP_047168039.1 uncharacterized protein LOC124836820 [Vigna umbellata]XP_047170903.1 uncharacterized protein LOC124839201 [Vigna umbellata]XP_047171777.1 uncharacterized protein LOC124839886 [Vigna umbellata]XP_047175543.1 uncharacterized protein LOC124842967 [Vigna umbellata]XP_047180654.1 uncharacterized protein LOC124847252 [Vigna umbellata]